MPIFSQESSAERRAEEGTRGSQTDAEEGTRVRGVSSWVVVKAIFQVMISIIIAGLALAQSMGLVPTEDLENGGTVFGAFVRRYLADPSRIIEDSRVVIGGLSSTVDMLEHVLQDSMAAATVVRTIRGGLPRRRRP